MRAALLWLALLLVCGLAHATGSVPKPATQQVAGWRGYGGTPPQCDSTDPIAAMRCSIMAEQHVSSGELGNCVFNTQTGTEVAGGCIYIPSGSYLMSGATAITMTVPGTCPANSTDAGSTCTCNANYQPNAANNACEPTPNQCASTLAKPLGGAGQEFQYPVASKTVPSRVCSGGCGYIPSGAAGSGAALWTKLGDTWTYVARSAADWIGDGLQCIAAPVGSPGTPPTTPPQPDPTPPPKGFCKGTVNGVEVVVACDSTSTSSGTGTGGTAPGSSSTGSSTGPSPDGTAPNTGAKNSDTTCSGSSCTTTTTTTTNHGDGTTTTETETQTQDKGDYCSEHPGSPQCEEENDPCKDAEDTMACLKVGTVPTPAAITGVTVTAAITPDTGWGADNGSCPAVVHTTLAGDVDPYALFCTYASGIRFAVIGFAFMVAVMIFLGRTD